MAEPLKLAGNRILRLEESHPFRATLLALESQECQQRFGAPWWRDVRRACDLVGARPVDDTLLLQLKEWCSGWVLRRGPGGPDGHVRHVPNRELVDEGATLVCAKNPRDLVVEYLQGLAPWDGAPIIEFGLGDAMGLALDGEPALVLAERKWLRRWMVAAVARALEPGCQSDSALVLVGPQGTGKSSCLRIIFGAAHTHDSDVDMESRDGAAVMGRAWCVELAELASVRRVSDVEQVKHFLTLREDTYRPPYARRAITTPRRSVCAGSTNDATPFVDSTGSRRFWPVRATRPFNPRRLAELRDLAWAAALAAYRAGEPWHLEGAEALEHARIADDYHPGDDWVELLRGWVEDLRPEQTVLLYDAGRHLDIKPAQWDRSAQHRVASALRQLGWVRVHTRAGKRWQRSPPLAMAPVTP